MGPPQNWSFCGERRSKGAGVVFAFRQKQSQADFATTTPGGWSALLRPQYSTMRSYFRAAERAHQHLSGFIVFSPASFEKEYSVESRTYAVSSDNKAFRPNMGGYSIYASSLDGSDPCVRLEQYMASEYGGKNGWQIERCYMMSDEVERAKALIRTEKEHER